MSTVRHKEALIVYHPRAGRAKDFDLDRVLANVVRRLCEESDYVARVRSLHLGVGADDLKDADLVIAVGGDGTIRRVLGAVAEAGETAGRERRSPDVAIIPVGTGNLFARYLGLFGQGIKDPINNAINVILEGDTIEVDLGKMNDQYFCIDAGVGPISNAIIAPKPGQKKRLKMFAYLAPLLQSMRKKPGVFRVNVDGEEFVVAASGIFITNADEMGIGTRGMEQVTDGMLDMCILQPKTLGDYWRITSRFAGWFLGGVASGDPPYTVRKIKRVRIETRPIPRPPSWWHRFRARFEQVLIGRPLADNSGQSQMVTMVDGDRCGFTPMEVEVVPAAVRIKIPRRPDAEPEATATRSASIQPGM